MIEYELISLLGASDITNYISVHLPFDFERYLANIVQGRIEYELNYSLRGAKFIFDETEKDICFINGPEEDTFIGICLGVCKLLNHYT